MRSSPLILAGLIAIAVCSRGGLTARAAAAWRGCVTDRGRYAPAIRGGHSAAASGEMRALPRREDPQGRPRPEHARRHPQGRRVGPGGRRPASRTRACSTRRSTTGRCRPARRTGSRGAEVGRPPPLDRGRARPAGPAAARGRRAVAVTQHDVIPILLRRCTACHGLRRQEGGPRPAHEGRDAPRRQVGPGDRPGQARARACSSRRSAPAQMPPRGRLVEASVKPIEPAEVEMLARWIAAGAPKSTSSRTSPTTTPDPLVTDKDRDFWAFRPPRPVAVPAVRHAERVRNPIDAFVLAEARSHRASTFRPEADRPTLLRRASLRPDRAAARAGGGRGLPRRPRPDAYEKLIDRLLASPRYGERWGRLARPGRLRRLGRQARAGPAPAARLALPRLRHPRLQRRQALRPLPARAARRRRAGRLRARPGDHAGDLRQPGRDRLPAHGPRRHLGEHHRLRPGPPRGDRRRDRRARLGGPGPDLKCARCHSHKFDPIPQRDYYRLVAVFKGAFDEYDWLKPDVGPGSARSARTCSPAGTCPTSRRPSAAPGKRTTPRSSTRSTPSSRAAEARRQVDAQIKALGPQASSARAQDPGALGPRRAVADLHLPPRRLR